MAKEIDKATKPNQKATIGKLEKQRFRVVVRVMTGRVIWKTERDRDYKDEIRININLLKNGNTNQTKIRQKKQKHNTGHI